MSEAVIEIHNLIKSYPGPDGATVPILHIPALLLAAGEQRAIAGPSGSGKTTLFHIVSGLLQPTAGEVLVFGEAIHRLSEAARDRFRAQHIGYIFQVSNLLPGFSALENVLLAMGFAGTIPAAQRRTRACELLERVGLSDRLHYRPNQLSSGQQQRVAIARALANRPQLLLADEPTAHLDYRTGQLVTALLHEVATEHGAALLLASHDQSLLASFPAVFELQRNDDGARVVDEPHVAHGVM